MEQNIIAPGKGPVLSNADLTIFFFRSKQEYMRAGQRSATSKGRNEIAY